MAAGFGFRCCTRRPAPEAAPGSVAEAHLLVSWVLQVACIVPAVGTGRWGQFLVKSRCVGPGREGPPSSHTSFPQPPADAQGLLTSKFTLLWP